MKNFPKKKNERIFSKDYTAQADFSGDDCDDDEICNRDEMKAKPMATMLPPDVKFPVINGFKRMKIDVAFDIDVEG